MTIAVNFQLKQLEKRRPEKNQGYKILFHIYCTSGLFWYVTSSKVSYSHSTLLKRNIHAKLTSWIPFELEVQAIPDSLLAKTKKKIGPVQSKNIFLQNLSIFYFDSSTKVDSFHVRSSFSNIKT